MTAPVLFQVATWLALASWLLLLLLPRGTATLWVIHRGGAILVLCSLYAVALAFAHPGPEGGGFGSLEQVTILFTHPWALCAGWIHYLAFDLFVGGWIARDAAKLAVKRWAVVPVLLLTFWLGPLGLLTYFAVVRRFGATAPLAPAPQP